jgi:hypothetical protein
MRKRKYERKVRWKKGKIRERKMKAANRKSEKPTYQIGIKGGRKLNPWGGGGKWRHTQTPPPPPRKTAVLLRG